MRGPKPWSGCHCVHMRHRKSLVAAIAAGSTPPECQMAPACQLALSSSSSHVSESPSIHVVDQMLTGQKYHVYRGLQGMLYAGAAVCWGKLPPVNAVPGSAWAPESLGQSSILRACSLGSA